METANYTSFKVEQENNKDDSKLPELLKWIHRFCSTKVDFQLASERRCLPPNYFISFAEKGIFGMLSQTEDGGLGLSMSQCLEILELTSRYDFSLSLHYGLHNFLGVPAISRLNNKKINNTVATGRGLVALAMSEESAGSFPKNIASTLTRLDDTTSVLNGEKIWIGSGSWARYIVVFAKNEEGQFKAVVVDSEQNDVQVAYEHKTMGFNGMVQAKLVFKNCTISNDMIIEGSGLAAAQESFNNGRIGICAIAFGGMKTGYQIAENYVINRNIAGGRMKDNPLIQKWMSYYQYHIEACERYLNKIKENLDTDRMHDYDYFISKPVFTETLDFLLDRFMQLLGGRGYMENNILARFYRDSRVLRVFEGPSETLFGHLGHLLCINNSYSFDKILDYNPEDWIEIVKALRKKDKEKFISARYYLGKLLSYYAVYSIGFKISDRLHFERVIEPHYREFISDVNENYPRKMDFKFQTIAFTHYDEDHKIDRMLISETD